MNLALANYQLQTPDPHDPRYRLTAPDQPTIPLIYLVSFDFLIIDIPSNYPPHNPYPAPLETIERFANALLHAQ